MTESLDHEAAMRGRTLNRSPTRPEIRALRTADESSTLRGRSRRRRSPSPYRATANANAATPTASPSNSQTVLMSPTRIRLMHDKRRREHCPSRRSSSRRVVRRRMSTSRARDATSSLSVEANNVTVAV